jgi:hypothetical protein
VVAGFWHIMWVAGVAVLVSGFAAMMVHSAGYVRLEHASMKEAVPVEAVQSQAPSEAAE